MDKDTTDRLDQLAKERDELREEVTQLRKSLETIQSKHEEEISGLKEQAADAAKSKEHAENQYRDLRGKVNTIKSQLGERMRQDAEELERMRAQVDDLEDQNRQLRDDNEQLRKHTEEHASEISTLRSRATLSQQNWIKERDELIQREAYAREEFETAKQAMQDWEVLAMEERSLRENLGDRVAELEDQLNNQREVLERAVNERDTQTSTVDGLQRALRDIQDGWSSIPSPIILGRANGSVKHARKSSARSSRTPRTSSRSSANSFKPQKKPPLRQRPNWRQRGKNWSEHCPLRRKSRRRTCSLASFVMRLSSSTTI